MEFKKSMLILIMAIFLVSIAGVCASDANDAMVASEDNLEIDQTADDVIGAAEDTDLASSEEDEILGADVQTFAQLNATINGNTDKDIYLNGNYKYSDGDDSFKKGIVINRDVNIYGNGYRIDGNGEARIFQIDGGNVVFYNMIFFYGNAGKERGDNGGAINGNCKVINCEFELNKAYCGGAMYKGSAVNCSFIGNSAEDLGGAMYGGTAVNCSFVSNGSPFYGSGMVGGTAVNCSFSDNSGCAMLEGYKMNCTGQDPGYYGTHDLVLHWDASNFTTVYGSAEKLPVQLMNQAKRLVDFINYDAVIYKDGSKVKTYHCLSNEEISLDLTPGVYTAELVVTYPGIVNPEPKNITLTIIETDGTTFWDLNNLITNCANDTIALDRDYTFNSTVDSAFSEGIIINRNVTINGNGYAINVNGKSRAFNVQTGNVTIGNLTIENANCSGDGGAVYFSQSGRVTNCSFTNNSARCGGAVFFEYGSDGFVENCNFVDNTALWVGGAVYFNGTGTVENCNFSSNSAYYGGAIGFNGTCAVTNCNFINNNASDSAGAILMSSGTMTNCNFINNTATYAGAVYFGGNCNVSNCNFADNSASLGGAVYYLGNGNVSNCNFADNSASLGGAVYYLGNGNVSNCNFTNNSASLGGAVSFTVTSNGYLSNCNFTNNSASQGGAVAFMVTSNGNVLNCNFADNSASLGGAVYFMGNSNGNVLNCNFADNSAGFGGAVYFSNGNVENCNFTGNNATKGSAIYFYSDENARTISNSIFLNNRANAEDLEVTKNENNITITFTGKDNLLNAIYSVDDVVFTNVTYWGANGIANTNSHAPSRSNKEAGQNITIGVVVNDVLVLNEVKVTDENGTIVLDINVGENYYISARHDTDSYYNGTEMIISNMTYNVNVTSKTSNNRTVNITAKSNIYNEVMPGKLLFILPSGVEINATYAAEGIWWAEHTFDDYADYQVNASYIGLGNLTISNATISITKANSTVDVASVVMDYGESANVTVKTEGATGITAKIDNADVSVVNNYTIQISGLNAGNHTLEVTTIPDGDHNSASKKVNVTVNKVDSTLTVSSVVLSYGESANVTVKTEGATGITAKINGDDAEVYGNTVVIPVLDSGNYTLTVTAIADENHNNVTKTAEITVNKADSTLTVCSVVLSHGESANVTVKTEGATGITAKINGDDAEVYGNTVAIPVLDSGNYTLTVTAIADENHNPVSENATITVNRLETELDANPITATYNVNKNLVITLKDSNGNPLSGENITVVLNGAKTYTTDVNGQVKVSTKGLAPGTYATSISFNDSANYCGCAKDVNVTVKKATPKITSKAKTFKAAEKTKKYTITLKNNIGKPIAKATVYLKVAGKTYKATTNSKGKATFKITKLSKKGTHKATVTFKANKYYKKATKKSKIKVIASFKTVSVGSKDSKTVKEIQRALKSNGYYISAYGHYLKVDGVYHGHTEAAVKQFQKDKGLKVTGKVDEKTAKKLKII